MKQSLLFGVCLVLCAVSVLAHGEGIEQELGAFTLELHAMPERLQPGDADFLFTLTRGGAPVPGEPVWVRIADGRRTYFAGTFVTDENGVIQFTYRIDTPGWYTFTAEVRDERGQFPVRVYGQYILLFGFLAAIFIVLALLVKKL